MRFIVFNWFSMNLYCRQRRHIEGTKWYAVGLADNPRRCHTYNKRGRKASLNFFIILTIENYAIDRWRRRRAVRTLSEAKGLRPQKVVCAFNSARDMVSSNLAMHSSANELLTTSTPVKSSTTRSSPSRSGISFSRACCPNWRVPKYLPKSIKLKVTNTF